MPKGSVCGVGGMLTECQVSNEKGSRRGHIYYSVIPSRERLIVSLEGVIVVVRARRAGSG